MRNTWLIQRLKPKPKGAFEAKVEQVFGGGMLMLKPDAWKLVQNIFGLEYMGAAEFEFGSLPKSWQKLAADAKELSACEARLASHPDTPVYVLCRKSQREGVINVLTELALDKLRLKERSYFSEVLDPKNKEQEYPVTTCGWYELDNGFFFFLDKEMWEKTTKLFRDNEYDDEVLEEEAKP